MEKLFRKIDCFIFHLRAGAGTVSKVEVYQTRLLPRNFLNCKLKLKFEISNQDTENVSFILAPPSARHSKFHQDLQENHFDNLQTHLKSSTPEIVF